MNAPAMIQGSIEWKRARMGNVGASRIADVMAKTKSGYAASRSNYAAQLIVERMTGLPAETHSNAAMEWGTLHEPDARAAYEFRTDATVTETGFVLHPTIEKAGASPDGLVGDEGLIEIKCPQTATHIETLLTGNVDRRYILQMQFQMACTGRKWCDFVSYDPRMPEQMRYFCKRIDRDENLIGEIEKEVKAFLAEVADTVKSLTAKYGAA